MPTPATRRDDLLLLLLALAVLVPGIGSQSGISGQDEYWLSFRTVLEMQERGEWLTPYVNGEVRLQKPPLLYWLMRVSFELLGPSLFAARIWAVLFGCLFVLLTARVDRQFGGRGLLAGLIALGAAGIAVEGRRAMFDLPVGCLATLAFAGAARWHAAGGLGALLGAAVALAAAAMTKGPVAIWFFAAPVVAAALVRRRPPAGPWWHVLPAVALFLALALPWPLWAQHRWPQFWAVMADQAQHREFGIDRLLRLPGLVASTLGLAAPWSLVAGAALVVALRRRQAIPGGGWLVSWFAIGLLPFALMAAFERYTLALLCPLAILIARWLAILTPVARRRALLATVALLGLPLAGFAAFTIWFGFALLSPLAAALLWALAFAAARRDRPHAVAALVAVILAVLLGAVYPAIGINRLPGDLPDDLATTPTATFGRPQPGMLSIMRGRSVLELPADPAGLGDRLAAFRGYLFVLDEDTASVEQAAAAAGVSLAWRGAFRSFYSRQAWLRFTRSGLSWAEWRQALATRSAAALAPLFVCYEVGSRG